MIKLRKWRFLELFFRSILWRDSSFFRCSLFRGKSANSSFVQWAARRAQARPISRQNCVRRGRKTNFAKSKRTHSRKTITAFYWQIMETALLEWMHKEADRAADKNADHEKKIKVCQFSFLPKIQTFRIFFTLFPNFIYLNLSLFSYFEPPHYLLTACNSNSATELFVKIHGIDKKIVYNILPEL